MLELTTMSESRTPFAPLALAYYGQALVLMGKVEAGYRIGEFRMIVPRYRRVTLNSLSIMFCV